MKRIARILASAAVAAVVLLAVERWCVRPWKCNIEVKHIAAATEQLLPQRGNFEAVLQARTNVQRLRKCAVTPSLGVLAHTVAGANSIVADQLHTAAQEYEAALRIDRRPELYLLLGTVLFELGEHERAVRAVARCLWSNPNMIDQLPEGHGTLSEQAREFLVKHPTPEGDDLSTP